MHVHILDGMLSTLLLVHLWISFQTCGGLKSLSPHIPATHPCPAMCICRIDRGSVPALFMVDCSGQNLTTVPGNLSRYTTNLDLGKNNISVLPGNAFRKLESLIELRLASNRLQELPRRIFRNNRLLQELWLQGNFFTSVPSRAIQSLSHLTELKLETNRISVVPPDSFRSLRNLKQLYLDTNRLREIPVAALVNLPSLEGINFNENLIKTIPSNAFSNNTRLAILLMADNLIETVSDEAFTGLSHLQIAQFQRNRLRHVPVALKSLPALEDLNMEDNRVEYLPDYTFQENPLLMFLQLKGNPITDVALHAFTNLPELEQITISEARDMSEFPSLEMSTRLESIRFDRANIKVIPSDLCHKRSKLKRLDVHSNRVSEIPNLEECSNMLSLNLGNNEITSLDGSIFRGLGQLTDLVLVHNYISYIPEDAFLGLTELRYLDLSYNKITEIHSLAFVPMSTLQDLNIGENRVSTLPTSGLSRLHHLKTFHNVELREFPAIDNFPEIDTLILSYAYHCCDFLETEVDTSEIKLDETISWIDRGENVDNFWISDNNSLYLPDFNDIVSSNLTVASIHGGLQDVYADASVQDLMEEWQGGDYFMEEPDNPYLYQSEEATEDLVVAKPAISCKPKPGPFMPCADLFGWWSLRCGVWFVFMLALLGNGVVLFVSITSKTKMDVPRFLICNLACADFFMGIYLGFLAIVDASTLGEFRRHAIWWQLSPGCVIAGFLGVLSSELSVFTLTVITLERFYAITHAMQLNKRLSLKHAGYVMVLGWTFSLGVASLPIFGISDFRKFAVCLPFDIDDVISKGYVCFIMVFNGISFFVILSCYFIMYLSIRDSQAWNSNDMRVAKRMALLVFTDFVCWAPIAFLSLTAAFGKNLIHLNEAKVLTIFVLPLNSCANPFLYAIFTKQFKKDCVLLCRRLEDSSMARHFSRASNRHGSSWASSRRPSGLNSLVPGEKRGSNSNSVSTGSQYGGLVNYNTDSYSGRNDSDRREGDPHRFDMEGHHCTCRVTSKRHKVKKVKNRNDENRRNRGKNVGCTDITVHHEFSSKDKSDDLNCTTESYMTSDADDDRSYRSARGRRSSQTCGHHACQGTVQSGAHAHNSKGQATPPIATVHNTIETVGSSNQASKCTKKIPWTQSIPCCSSESSPVDTDKQCSYENVPFHDDSNGSSERCVQCCSAQSTKPRPSASKDNKLFQAQVEVQYVMDTKPAVRRYPRKHNYNDRKRNYVESSFVELAIKPVPVVEITPEKVSESLSVSKRKKEKIDKNVHLKFFTQSLAENDFIHSSVCRSNSLVDLSHPSLSPIPNKRLSLTPGQEGYILLSGATNRDSAFVDGSHEFDVPHLSLDDCAEDSYPIREAKGGKRRQTAADTSSNEEETTQLLLDDSEVKDSTCAYRSSGHKLSSIKSCDKESGFVSEC